MHFNAPLLTSLLLSAATITTASPLPQPEASPVELVPRACTTETPDYVIWISEEFPNWNVPVGTVHLERTGGPGSNTHRTGFTFTNIPEGATGCMLQWELPRVFRGDEYARGVNNFDVFGVDSPVWYDTNWNNQPNKTTKWASVNVPTWPTEEPMKTILMSNTCSPTMSFMAELSDWQQDAGVIEFLNSGFRPEPIQRGFKIVYNC